ncbi:MAG TPA: hypothetical protein VHO70_18280 [Chitinispirillaceae bacterium]|nr:hypothetical protein [Chitinispirillaceae bacterium]
MFSFGRKLWKLASFLITLANTLLSRMKPFTLPYRKASTIPSYVVFQTAPADFWISHVVSRIISDAPENTSISSEDTSISPEDTSISSEDTSISPEDTSISSDDTSISPEDISISSDDTSVAPRSH